ncbi:venom acid phosphatase Acph-1-like [Euwallacea fornicatus]|uniref:venom acid phosphatase Acph-1-like n=1 Tax=Euwallacea fornicatus TaxID=995702 RepID=UPI00338EB9B3
MASLVLLVPVLACLLVSPMANSACVLGEPEGLVLTHILFRHGNRTIEDNIYDTNPYGNESFWEPYGYDQLTQEGRRTEYNLGQAFRKRYDDLLGPDYHYDKIEARSTITDRTKMSLMLVLASLFPPTNKFDWNDNLKWHPVPFSTFDYDKELYGRKVCTNYDTWYKKYVKTDEVLALLKPYQDMFDYVTTKSGKEIQKAKKVAKLYIEMLAQSFYGYPLEDWFYTYEQQLFNVTVLNYRLMAGKKKLKRLSTGYLLRKIIQDTESRISDVDSPTKMFLYSAHEKNIATLLVTLDMFDDMIPTFGSYVLMEVHRIDGVHGFKFYYQNYIEAEPKLLVMPGCEEFCPFDTFKELVADFLPEDDAYCELDN